MLGSHDGSSCDLGTRVPPSIESVWEGIPVCAPLEMPDRYRFHSLRRPRLKLSDALLMMFVSIVTSLRLLVLSIRLKVYLMGVVRGSSLVSSTKTASSFAGSVLLALRLIEWIAPGGSDQLSPAR